jgi:hypothetical protein
MSNIIGNRNSTPEASTLTGSTLRPPTSRTLGSGHHLRASADMGAFSASSSLANRGIRPSSEVYFNQFQQGTNAGNPEDAAEKAAQQWIADIDQYETTLEEMAAATLDQDFKDELSAIEQWFRVLSEPERTAALYALLQQTTQVQIRFFIQVLQQMAKSHPMSSVLSPAGFGEKDTMSSRMNDAMNKLNVEGSRGSFGFGNKPPPSPGGAKRMSGLDPTTIKSMFPDAANAIEDQKAEFQKTTGNAPPKSNRNSTIGDRNSYAATLEDDSKKNGSSGIPAGPWRNAGAASTTENQPPIGRPKSSSSQQPQGGSAPMGQFGLGQPPQSAGLRGTRPFPLTSDNNISSQTASDHNNLNTYGGMPLMTPFPPGASWASMTNTPMVPTFNHHAQAASQADMIANATAMKLAALSTVNNRIQLDDVRKYRRARSQEGGAGSGQPMSPAGLPHNNILMTNEHGQILTPEQAALLQQQQIAALQGRRSRPASPGIAITGPVGGMQPHFMHQNNGFLTALNGNQHSAALAGLNAGLAGMNLGGYPNGAVGLGGFGSPGAVGGPGLAAANNNLANEGYLSDASEILRGRSPRGRRGSSKPPEDPTDLALLQDIPNWLRTLRLHKYTDQLKDVPWKELVQLDEAGLEGKGVAAKGARSKLLKV